ncbi:MAG TPA: chemotaxis protein CheW [Nitrospirota bacterium]|nr:chemotaxis protein CheW [Nitrospirota bacterium]
MNEGTRFLIVSLGGESYAIPITRLLEIAVPQAIKKDANLTEVFEGKFEFRGKWVPVLNIKKILQLPGKPGTALLVVNSAKGVLGIQVDAVTEIIDMAQKPVPVPKGVMNPTTLQYFGGILRYRDELILLLNEDGLLP